MDVLVAVSAFALLAGLLTLTPGLDTALVLRAALVGGPRAATVTGFGIVTGGLIWGVAAAAGVAALLTASQTAYAALKLVGAGYMCVAGARLLLGAVRTSPTTHPDDDRQPRGILTTPESPGYRPWAEWRRGLFTNLTNPKVGAFYVAVLPQFIPADTQPASMGALLALVHGVETIAWFALLTLASARLAPALRRRSAQRALNGGTGASLIGFGLALGFSAR